MADDFDIFMSTMVARTAPVPLGRAVALAREEFGIEVRATRLTGERDENFRLRALDGAEYVLKIANPEEQPEITDLANAALLHLEKADPGLPCPRVMRSRDGRTHVRYPDENGKERTARVLTYLPGEPLRTVERTQRQRIACGILGARLAKALRNFEHPASRRLLIWDVRHAQQVLRLLEQLPDFPAAPLAADLLRCIVPRIDALWPHLRQQVVHNDLNSANILVDPADGDRITGVIDFGDATETAIIADVAVAAADLIPTNYVAGTENARASVLDVASGYHGELPLLPLELGMLGPLVAARLIMNVVIPQWHVHNNPSKDHFAALDPGFIRARLTIAEELLHATFTL